MPKNPIACERDNSDNSFTDCKFGMQMSFTQMKAKFDKGAKSTKEYGLAAILKNLTIEKWPVVP